jgi:hypothetical protein
MSNSYPSERTMGAKAPSARKVVRTATIKVDSSFLRGVSMTTISKGS